ncbi:MAG TPA: glycosyltransferase [Candidatus Paceibacterota bacterium]|nr:glycosyltransferase [Candidatus Paceibacterota bacterium]
MKTERLVVIIPTKNRRALLERALGSALSQSYQNFRVVITNDGSTDDTQAYLDSLKDPRIRVIHHEKSRGVRAGYNNGLRSLREGEWGVPLDDDDIFLPGALQTVADAVAQAPENVESLFFNTITQTPTEEFVGGYQFKEGETVHDVTYEELMAGKGGSFRGDSRVAYKWTLFPKYLYIEDVNGLESEMDMLRARDGVGRRHVRKTITRVDFTDAVGEHLSHYAAKRDPASFVRANARIFRDHEAFFAEHPRLAMQRAVGAIRIALRAFDPLHAAQFSFYYLRAATKLALGQGKET